MFICDECLEKSFTNRPTLFKSQGKCEMCEKPKVCNDIPSKFLVPKGEEDRK